MQVTINLDDTLDNIVAQVTKLKERKETRRIVCDWLAIAPCVDSIYLVDSIFLGIQNAIPQVGRIDGFHCVQLTQSEIRDLIRELQGTLV